MWREAIKKFFYMIDISRDKKKIKRDKEAKDHFFKVILKTRSLCQNVDSRRNQVIPKHFLEMLILSEIYTKIDIPNMISKKRPFYPNIDISQILAKNSTKGIPKKVPFLEMSTFTLISKNV